MFKIRPSGDNQPTGSSFLSVSSSYSWCRKLTDQPEKGFWEAIYYHQLFLELQCLSPHKQTCSSIWIWTPNLKSHLWSNTVDWHEIMFDEGCGWLKQTVDQAAWRSESEPILDYSVLLFLLELCSVLKCITTLTILHNKIIYLYIR